MMEDLNKLRQVKDTVYTVPRVAYDDSDFNINYEKTLDFYERLTNLIEETPNDQDLGRMVRNLI